MLLSISRLPELRRRSLLPILVACVTLLVAACSPQDDPTPTPFPTELPPTATATLAPTATPPPTATAVPPTPTAVATNTPQPEPTATTGPIVAGDIALGITVDGILGDAPVQWRLRVDDGTAGVISAVKDDSNENYNDECRQHGGDSQALPIHFRLFR